MDRTKKFTVIHKKRPDGARYIQGRQLFNCGGYRLDVARQMAEDAAKGALKKSYIEHEDDNSPEYMAKPEDIETEGVRGLFDLDTSELKRMVSQKGGKWTTKSEGIRFLQENS